MIKMLLAFILISVIIYIVKDTFVKLNSDEKISMFETLTKVVFVLALSTILVLTIVFLF